jgi:hypothetical protein
MRVTFRGPLPPDHPIFHGGAGFVFRNDLPEEPEHQDESESDQPEDES